MRRTTIAALATTTMLAAPAAAQAHVTLQPEQAPAGGFTRLDVRVPNEEPDRGTTKVQVQMPPGFAFVSYEPVPGWKVDVKRTKLAKPVKTDDGELTEQVSQITWTGDGKQGIVRPGQFQDFGLSVRVPDGKPGSKLTFKSLQTYQGGQVVRWIGPPDAEKPAPQVTLTAAEGGHDAAAAAASTSSPAGPPEDDGPSTGLVIVALGLGAAGLAAGAAALARGRRPAA
ncbi:MAG TPA: YcnI family protein [Thermoleophilaceae bacterium]|nr:YcnI family protein [Thermoleophilaceae bacterium]